jgi:putative ABC transport system permease protein
VSAIFLKMLRNLRDVKWRAVTIAVTVASGVAVYAGVDMAIRSIFETRETLYRQTHFADLEVLFLPEDVNNLPRLDDLPGVLQVERRLIFPGTVLMSGGRRLPGIVTFLDNHRPEVNALNLEQGEAFAADDLEGVVAERSLRDHHGVKPGDPIRVKVGEKIYDSIVRGVAFSPEFLTTSSNPDYFIPEKGGLGVVFANLRRVSDVLGFTMVNDLVFRYADGADAEATQAAILERLAKLNIERVIPQRDHFSYKFIQMDLSSVKRYVPAIIVVLCAVSFLLTLMTFDRLVEEERREVGMLLALGYARRRVLAAYVFGAACLGIAGCAAGLIASLIVRELFALIYSSALGLPDILTRVYPVSMVKAAALGFATALVSAALPAGRLLFGRGRRGLPQAIIRGALAGGYREGAWMRRLTARMSGWSFAYRFGLRNLFRRKALTASMILSMALALGVAASYQISVNSIRETVRRTFAREHWDAAVDFLYPVYRDDVVDLSARWPEMETEPYFRGTVEIATDGDTVMSAMLGIPPDTRMKHIGLVRGPGFGAGHGDEIVLSQDLARKTGADVGDTVRVTVRRQTTPLTVAGVTSEIIIGQSLVDFERARGMAGYPDEVSGMYVRGIRDPAALLDLLYAEEYVGKVTLRDGLVGDFMRVIGEITKIVYLAAGISIFVAILFIVAGINLTIAERESEYAILKSLGYGRDVVGRIILTESLAQGVAAAALSVPIAWAIAGYLTSRMSQAWFHIEPYATPASFLCIILPALVLIPLSAHPGIRRMAGVDVADVLRRKTIE